GAGNERQRRLRPNARGRLAAAQREPREARDWTVGAGGRGDLTAVAVVNVPPARRDAADLAAGTPVLVRPELDSAQDPPAARRQAARGSARVQTSRKKVRSRARHTRRAVVLGPRNRPGGRLLPNDVRDSSVARVVDSREVVRRRELRLRRYRSPERVPARTVEIHPRVASRDPALADTVRAYAVEPCLRR